MATAQHERQAEPLHFAIRQVFCEVNIPSMQIRKLAHQEIDTIVEFLQAMLDEMASFGGHVLQNPHSISNGFRDSIQSQLESPDHLFLAAELNASSSPLIGILEARITELHPIFLPKSSLHIHAIYVAPEYRRSGVG